MAPLEQRLQLFEMAGQDHQHRRAAIGRQPVTFVRPQLFGAMQDIQIGQQALQVMQQLVLVDSRQHAIDAFVVQNIHQAPSIIVIGSTHPSSFSARPELTAFQGSLNLRIT